MGWIALGIVAFYVLPGLALAQLLWRDVDEGAVGSHHYWTALLLIVVAWPKAIYDIRRASKERRGTGDE